MEKLWPGSVTSLGELTFRFVYKTRGEGLHDKHKVARLEE